MMVNGKRLLLVVATGLLVFGSLGIVWAQLFNDYNRPEPLMDYAPQALGIYDTKYINIGETDCRDCHGDSLANRHHYTERAMNEGCAVPEGCHEVGPPPDYGVIVIRDCTTAGCHEYPTDIFTNGWHHLTPLSDTGQCTACHNPNLLDDLQDVQTYIPTVVTPTPVACENCHWSQLVDDSGWQFEDPDPTYPNAGHPSTYEFDWIDYTGYYEYGKKLEANYEAHHMGDLGNVYSKCYNCHAQDPGAPDFDPLSLQAMRYCERCHTVGSVHSIYGHVSGAALAGAWEAVGFHVPDLSNGDPTDLNPTVYTTFTTNDLCWGCHGGNVPAPPVPPSATPAISGIFPNAGCCGSVGGDIELVGTDFGEEQLAGYYVEIRLPPSTVWIPMTGISSWTDTRIVFQIPCWTFTKGTYRVRVVNPGGTSNFISYTLIDCPTPSNLSPAQAPCGTWITVSSTTGDLGTAQTESLPGGFYISRVVDVVSSATGHDYQARAYQNWSTTSFQVRFYSFFQDAVPRNYVEDGEDIIGACVGMGEGAYDVYVNTVIFDDSTGSSPGVLDAGDTILNEFNSDALQFTLTRDPTIYKLRPSRLDNGKLFWIVGDNFGPTQEDSTVHIGKQTFNAASGRIKSWDSTRIKMRASNYRCTAFGLVEDGGGAFHPDGTNILKRNVWVTVDAVDSNTKKLTTNDCGCLDKTLPITGPTPCP